MNTEVNTSIGTDDDQIKLVFQAKTIASIIDLKDGTILRMSSKEYGIIKNGAVQILEVTNVPLHFQEAYQKFEGLDSPPKYPYVIEMVSKDV